MTEIKKINSPELYEWFIKEVEDTLDVLLLERQEEYRGREVVLNSYKEYKEIIDLCCNYNYDILSRSTSLSLLYNLKFDLSKVNLVQNKINISAIKNFTKTILNCNKVIKEKDITIEELKNVVISYEVFKEVIDSFNLELLDKMLEGYIFNLGYRLKTIRVKKKERKKANINWGESNKIKQSIIDRGGIPYHKDTAPNGENWFVYFTSDVEYWWYWNKLGVKVQNKHQPYYSFSPSSGENGAKAKLRKVLNSNPYAKLNFVE